MAAAPLPAVELFSTSILSNHAVRKRHERYTSVLTIKKIPYVYHDMASDEDAKQRWRSKARDPTIPGLLVHNEWRGTFAEFEEAVEFNELDFFLAIDHERLKREQALMAANGDAATAGESNGEAKAEDQAAAAATAANTSGASSANGTAATVAAAAPAKYTGDAPPPFAPEGSGKRRSLNADDFLKALGIDESSLDINDAELAELLNDSSLRQANRDTATKLGVTEGDGAASNGGLRSNAAQGIGASAAARNAERKAQRAAMSAEQLKGEGLGPLAEGAPVELFTTSLLSNTGVRERHERFLEVLSSHQIHFRKYDLIVDDDAKRRWRARTRDSQLPGILVHGEWRGSFAEFDAAASQGADALNRWLNIDSRLADASVRAAAKSTAAATAAAAAGEDASAAEPANGGASSKRFSLAVDDFLASLGVADLTLDDAAVDQLLNGEGVPNVPGGQGAPIVPPLRTAPASAPAPEHSAIQEEDEEEEGEEPKKEEAAAVEVEEKPQEADKEAVGDEVAIKEQDKAPEQAMVDVPADAEDGKKIVDKEEGEEGEKADASIAAVAEEEEALTKAADGEVADEVAAEAKPAGEEAKMAEAEASAVEPLEPLTSADETTTDPEAAKEPTPIGAVIAEEVQLADIPDEDEEADADAGPIVPAKEEEKELPTPMPDETTDPSTLEEEVGASSALASTSPSSPTAASSPAATMRKHPRKSKSRAANSSMSPDADEAEEEGVFTGRRGMDFQRPSAYALEPSASLSAIPPASPDGGLLMPRSVSTSSALSSSSRNRSGSGSAKKGLGSRLSSMKFGKDRDKDKDRGLSASGSSSSGFGNGDDAGADGGSPSGGLRSRASREGLFKSRSRSPASAGRFKPSSSNAPPVPAMPSSRVLSRHASGGVGAALRAERTLSQILRDADEAMRTADAQIAGVDSDGAGAGAGGLVGGDGEDEEDEEGAGMSEAEDGLEEGGPGTGSGGRSRAPDPFGEDQVKVGG
ncbi:hypothetical protein OC844_002588 [Tilletia horrida]|nr:hypothetical protein OC844_002588 [Tilletia horrida]